MHSFCPWMGRQVRQHNLHYPHSLALQFLSNEAGEGGTLSQDLIFRQMCSPPESPTSRKSNHQSGCIIGHFPSWPCQQRYSLAADGHCINKRKCRKKTPTVVWPCGMNMFYPPLWPALHTTFKHPHENQSKDGKSQLTQTWKPSSCCISLHEMAFAGLNSKPWTCGKMLG